MTVIPFEPRKKQENKPQKKYSAGNIFHINRPNRAAGNTNSGKRKETACPFPLAQQQHLSGISERNR